MFDDGKLWADDENGEDENKIDSSSMFLEGHNQATMHGVKVAKEDCSIVANFIGSSMPCADKGD